jgi:hypothetical protein
MAVTYGMTTPIMSSVVPNPTTVPVMSTVMPNPMTITTVVSSMGVQGLPMSNALPIIVNENTPNLAEIQSFPVIVSGGGIHMHQDPVSGQRYRMSDDFHSRIPQILADRESALVSDSILPIQLLEKKSSTNQSISTITNLIKSTNPVYSNEQEIVTSISDISVYTNNGTLDQPVESSNYSTYADWLLQNKSPSYVDTSMFVSSIPEQTFTLSTENQTVMSNVDNVLKNQIENENLSKIDKKNISDANDFSIPKYDSNLNTTVPVKLNYPTNMFSNNTFNQIPSVVENISINIPMNSFYGGTNRFGVSNNYYNSTISRLPVNSYIDM